VGAMVGDGVGVRVCSTCVHAWLHTHSYSSLLSFLPFFLTVHAAGPGGDCDVRERSLVRLGPLGDLLCGIVLMQAHDAVRLGELLRDFEGSCSSIVASEPQ
jgi:hypothetical protein